jgi:hypothetical protein
VTGFIVNPRKAVRIPVQCDAWLLAGRRGWTTRTEDVGAHGCRVLAPERIREGDEVHLDLTCPRSPSKLEVRGRVAWAGGGGPWRLGIAYAVPDQAAASSWFDEVLRSHGQLRWSGSDRVPERIGLHTLLFVGPFPRGSPQLGDEEAAVLLLACARPTAKQFRQAMAADWTRAERALFALLARGLVTLDRSKEGDAAAWRAFLRGWAPTGGYPRA